jgi:hypothetical protein
VLPRSISWAPEPDGYRRAIAELDRVGLPVVDHCRGTIPVDPDVLPDRWRMLVHDLPPGLTHFALHCTTPSDAFVTLTPNHAIWRFAEYELVASGFVRNQLDASKIEVIGTRELQRRWLERMLNAEPRWI